MAQLLKHPIEPLSKLPEGFKTLLGLVYDESSHHNIFPTPTTVAVGMFGTGLFYFPSFLHSCWLPENLIKSGRYTSGKTSLKLFSSNPIYLVAEKTFQNPAARQTTTPCFTVPSYECYLPIYTVCYMHNNVFPLISGERLR